jgi:hypothetical protein
VRNNMFLDTPLPPEEPAGQNPPDGAMLDYYLSSDAKDVKLEIIDSKGDVIRKFSSADKPKVVDSLLVQYPMYWIRPVKLVSAKAGHHRIVWDLRYADPKGAPRQLSIAANYKNTATGPVGPYVHPGNYTVRLTVDGNVSEQSITIRMDPRVSISESDLRLQTDHSLICYQSYHELESIREMIDILLNNPKTKWGKGKKEQVVALRGNGAPDNPDIIYGSAYESALENESIVGLQDKLLHVLAVLQSADVKPTSQSIQAVEKLKMRKDEMIARWKSLKIGK